MILGCCHWRNHKLQRHRSHSLICQAAIQQTPSRTSESFGNLEVGSWSLGSISANLRKRRYNFGSSYSEVGRLFPTHFWCIWKQWLDWQSVRLSESQRPSHFCVWCISPKLDWELERLEFRTIRFRWATFWNCKSGHWSRAFAPPEKPMTSPQKPLWNLERVTNLEVFEIRIGYSESDNSSRLVVGKINSFRHFASTNGNHQSAWNTWKYGWVLSKVKKCFQGRYRKNFQCTDCSFW